MTYIQENDYQYITKGALQGIVARFSFNILSVNDLH